MQEASLPYYVSMLCSPRQVLLIKPLIGTPATPRALAPLDEMLAQLSEQLSLAVKTLAALAKQHK